MYLGRIPWWQERVAKATHHMADKKQRKEQKETRDKIASMIYF
jgi:hypothetical protein